MKGFGNPLFEQNELAPRTIPSPHVDKLATKLTPMIVDAAGGSMALGDVIESMVEGLDSDCQALVGYAGGLGWRISTDTNDATHQVILTSHDGKKAFLAPGRKVRVAKMRALITRHADPERLETLQLLKQESKNRARQNGQANERSYFDEAVDGLPVSVEIRSESFDPPEAKQRPVPRHIVETKPMLAKGSSGTDISVAYTSKIAIERVWSDGSVDYKCVLCDFTTEERLGVRGHWRKHLNAGEAEPVGQPERGDYFAAEVPNAASYRPRQSRIEALAELLAQAGDLSPEELARLALTWVHEQSNKGSKLSGEAEELTDSEIVQRLRTMLSGGEIAKHAAELEELRHDTQQELAALRQELEEVRCEREKYKERAARHEGDMQALRDLISGMAGEEGQ